MDVALDDAFRLERLTPPAGTVRMVLDTDTFNEIDDQFAVVYSLLSPERISVEAIYAAPFHNSRSTGPGDGMERSYEEILRLLERMNRPPEGFAFRGSDRYLPGPDQAVASPAAEDLVRRAMFGADSPLYVVAIGAITNIASAILIEPRIRERIVVVWLGGNPVNWPHTREFNLQQDVHASRLLFDCGVPFVHVPCINVAQHVRTTLSEVEQNILGRGPIGDYLCEIYRNHFSDHFARSKVLWDLVPVAWLVNSKWVPTILEHSPILNDGLTWSVDPGRHLIRSAVHASRDGILGDLFRKLEANA